MTRGTCLIEFVSYYGHIEYMELLRYSSWKMLAKYLCSQCGWWKFGCPVFTMCNESIFYNTSFEIIKIRIYVHMEQFKKNWSLKNRLVYSGGQRRWKFQQFQMSNILPLYSKWSIATTCATNDRKMEKREETGAAFVRKDCNVVKVWLGHCHWLDVCGLLWG